ncbi:two-component response regulator ARR14-like [Vigna radiata var. radiata]|uniref:Two-component response regulator ARR14-like n=1 Tax=Vigna radiata var. radiata TaxID=3916 RepID=A0A1S3ULG1_VIGRR|nr:two-component response regulator ARR14-like [Vigna radiata var. radiata]
MAEISSTDFPDFPSILNVLVIDSELNVLDFIKKTCNQYSYQVMACSESISAVNILRERKTHIHLILIEVDMPVMDGYEFMLFVNKEGINVPVIVMSHDDSKPCIMKTVQLGACDYWKKPLNEDIMIKNMWTHAFRKFLGEDRTQKNTDENDKTREDASSIVDRNKSNFREVDESENSNPLATGKDRIVWTPELHTKFLDAVKRLGPENAVPKKILEAMNMPNLKRGHVASHLQKYRKFLKEEEEKQQQPNEPNEISGNKKPRVHASGENNLQPLTHPGLTCNMGPTREKPYDSNVQVAEHFHAEPTLVHDLSYPLATFPNISITNNFPQSSGYGYGLNNRQQPMMRPQIPSINLQPSSIIISDNSASAPQNYNFRMNMPPQSIHRASMYYPQPQNAGFSNGVVRSFAASTDIDDQTIKKQLNSMNNGHHKP